MEGIGLSEIKAARKALDAKRARDAPDGIQLRNKMARAARRALPEIKAARKALDAKRPRDAPDGIQLSRRAKAARRARQSKRKDKKLMSAQSARAQRFEVLGRDGAWKQAAQEMARLCQQSTLDYCPPAYAALSLPTCLSMTSQMYECLEQAEWRTCVVCWRAWYDPHRITISSSWCLAADRCQFLGSISRRARF